MFAARVLAMQDDSITLGVAGHVSLDRLPEIERLIDRRKQVVLDLSEVTLLDQAAAMFFGEKLGGGAEVVNCPRYIEDWIQTWIPGNRG
jgi:anti-anti-sigma regulatory factor